MAHKRGSTDAAAAARRESFAEQKPATGIIGKMWNKYVYPEKCEEEYHG